VVKEQSGSITDVSGIRVGHWTDRRAATGCTVVLCPPEGAVGGIDVRGGAPGTRETDLLRPGTLVERVHAIVLAGGSAYGLDAASGVMRYLEEQGVGVEYGGTRVPIVPAAILFDLGVGRGDVRPTADSGHRAARAAKAGSIEEGSAGAATGATVAGAAGRELMLKGGVGTASERGPDGIIVGAIAAVNAAGDIIDPESGRRIAGPRGDKPGRMLDGWKIIASGKTPEHEHGANTTLAVVATNAVLSVGQANRLASVAHDGFARAIRPSHTMVDGDIVFALATGDLGLASPAHVRAIEALAVRAVERAIVRGVTEATGLAGVPSVGEWRSRR
jgi:L-aminopeptidase/D-esterase-like protein